MPWKYVRALLLLLAFCLCSPVFGRSAEPSPATATPSAVPGADAVKELLRQAKAIKDTQPQQSLDKGRQALALARRLGDQRQELSAIHLIGGLLMASNDYDGAMTAGTEGLILSNTLGNKTEQAEFHLLLSSAFWGKGDLPGAAAQAMEFLHAGEVLGDKVIQQRAEETLGVICGSTDDFKGARQHFEASLRLAEESHSPHLGRLLINLGDACQREKDFPNARLYLERALPLTRGEKDPTNLAGVLYSLGEVTSLQGDQAQAARYLEEGLTAARNSHNDLFVAHIYRVSGAMNRRLGRLDVAWDQLQQSLALADKLKNVDLFTQLYDECIQTAKARNDYRAALEYADKLAGVNETIRGEKSRLKVVELENRYEAQTRLHRIELLERDREIQRSELALQKTELTRVLTQRYALVAVVVCAGLAVAAWLSRQRARAKLTQKDLVETRAAKQQVEQADAQKARLLAVATQDLRESEVRFRNAFENSPLGIALVTPAGQWLRINPALCKIMGHEATETLTKTVQDFTHPDDLAESKRMIDRLIGGEADACHLEQRFIRSDGRVVWTWVDTSIVREPSTGQPLYLIFQVQDVTEKKRADEVLLVTKQEAERANAAKSEFLSRVSHELRTPLNAILGFGQLLELDVADAPQRESVEHILKAGRHLLDLIDELLDISRIETGRVAFACEPVPVNEAVQKAIDFVRPLAEKASVELAVDSQPDRSVHVQADLRRLTQVLLNLLSNAVKYNHAGGRVVVRCRDTGNSSRLRIEVSDTGPGISPGEQHLIFAPFARLAATNAVPGTGLGLFLSKVLVEAMDGRLGLESIPGQGSTFWVELIRTGEAEGSLDRAGSTSHPHEQTAYDHRATVLYIEDNLDNLQLVERTLARQPHIRLIAAMQGSLGLELAKEHRPDLILLDLHLLDMPGVEVVESLRQQPETCSTPVIVISADATFNHLETLRELGIREYMTKPYNIGDLNRAINEALAQRACLV
ncbi:MAG: PAS domain S-box protein [Rhodospirillales bacterium]|nr:PAS domain S-box protein [Acetobacter sp.]